MAKARTVTLLTSTGSTMSQYSAEIPLATNFCNRESFYTIQVMYKDYVGRFRIQGTLSDTPGANDWVDIIPETTTGDFFNPQGYLQWNLNVNATPQGSGNISEAYTFRGNYTYIRVYMDRSYIGLPSNNYDTSYGQIGRVLLSY